MKNDLKKLIMMTVNEYGPIRATELVTEIISTIHDPVYKMSDSIDDDIISAIRKCVEDGSIVEVEYILKDMDYRIKSMYFPAGTKIINHA